MTGAYLDDKVWSAKGDIFLSKAGKPGLGMRCHGGESQENVLWQGLFQIGGQGGGDRLN